MKSKYKFLNSQLEIEDISSILNVPFSQLIRHIENPNYTKFNIPKKSGGHREVFAPSHDLMKILHVVNKKLRSTYHMMQPKVVHGFTYKTLKEKFLDIGIKANAKMHVNKKCILNVDIKDFFPSISASGVREIFESPPFNYSRNTATGLALLLCYKGKLPAGAPTSPLISNFYCLKMDSDLLEISKSGNIVYSRYADDLTFSSDDIIEAEFVVKVSEILKVYGFETNRKKLRKALSFQAQYVTGIKVNQTLNLNRIYYRNLRAVLHSIEQVGISTSMLKYKDKKRYFLGDEHKFLSSVRSRIEYLGYIRGNNDVLYRELKNKLNANLEKSN